MPKPPRRMEAKAQNIEQTADSILPPRFASTQDLIQRSPNSSPQKSKRSPYPLPRPDIDELTKGEWTREKSLRLDWALWYLQQEFELEVGDE